MQNAKSGKGVSTFAASSFFMAGRII